MQYSISPNKYDSRSLELSLLKDLLLFDDGSKAVSVIPIKTEVNGQTVNDAEF
jgi:hypothetical protein